ncbi:hypothetical protein BVRB_8g181060 [Beta vulgaris subsp. vulgaris]|nr:hypothetical protein BVRB_8g181060 [Beta vulgaris subsp. vulgaris]
MNHDETVVEFQATEKQILGCSVNDATVSETVIVIPEDLPVSENRSTESCATGIVDEAEVSENNNKDVDKKLWVVVDDDDDKCGEDGERVCRICHLNSEQPWKLAFFASKTDLILLGCGCKGELSVSHLYCAEAWFKLKGNRICEICGETANNVRGVGNESFMEEWKDSRMTANATDASDRSAEGCWHGQPLCNFLMACLVIAFVLPWFFRVNMF